MESICLRLISVLTSPDWAVVGSLLSGCGTVAVACLTCSVIKENRLLRQAGDKPNVVAHFDFHPEGNGALNIALTNVGSGPALDVSFRFEYEKEDFENYDIKVDFTCERTGITLIPQGQKISFLFAVGFMLFRPKNELVSTHLKAFQIVVTWKDASRRAYEQSYTLDVEPYGGLPGLTSKPPIMKAVEELKKISKKIGSKEIHLVTLVETTTLESSRVTRTKGGDGK